MKLAPQPVAAPLTIDDLEHLEAQPDTEDNRAACMLADQAVRDAAHEQLDELLDFIHTRRPALAAMAAMRALL